MSYNLETIMCNKMLYVGAGCHIEPVKHFPHTKLFIFIDSQPRSQFDNIYPKYNKKFYKKNFCKKLEKKCAEFGFYLQKISCLNPYYHNKITNWKQYFLEKIPKDINPSMLEFKNKLTKQTIRYYISTNIRRNFNIRLYTEIKTSDSIIVSGYYPENEIFDIFDAPKKLFAYTNTLYDVDTSEFNPVYDNNIIYYLKIHKNKAHHYFTSFNIVNYDTGNITTLYDYDKFISVTNNYPQILSNDELYIEIDD